MISKMAEVILTKTNYTTGRNGCRIERITPHCIVGHYKAKDLTTWSKFNDGKTASMNYIIGKDGDIVCMVDEDNRAWTSSSRDNDFRAITFECSSNASAPNKIDDAAYESLIKLVVDIMKRYGRKRLVYIPDKNQALSYKVKDDEMLLTFHRWFAAVACPGNWFVDHANEFVKRVNDSISGDVTKLYHVQIGAFRSKDNADRLANELKSKGYETYIVEY